ncbi:ABC transporter permease [Neotabrizicola shimadae]|uniref:ABC transporter permease n=1 Tax=Neotabrizicola shimadae TaxID=2807096 RepID=A0A8G1ECW5_9RHOB|nr:ABC transporter permease [Neotabrizicola shimadae]QYZ69611.1 ABC transporter permease [Neotabrizicola shimadae]
MNARMSWFNVTAVALGLAFLYLPMLIVVIYSFNASKLVTVWGGFSTHWYGVLFANQDFLDAAMVSVRIGLMSATLATVLGTMAAYVMVRGGTFPGRTLFSGLVYAPLVMPEVIMGLSMLLLFIAVGLDRGQGTIMLAQATLEMCFVCVVVSSRLATHDRAMDEAAMDLGCTPAKVFWLVTLPNIAPAILSGWLLAFSMSLDDLVMASFTSGPSSTTLPLRLYSSVRTGVSPEINALSSLVIGVVALGLVTTAVINRKTMQRRHRREPDAAQVSRATRNGHHIQLGKQR